MERTIILSVIGQDRPGLTRIIADAVLAAEGNWLESQLTHMAGRYVGAVLVSVPSERAEDLETAVRAIDPHGLTVTLAPADVEREAKPAGRLVRLEVLGQDRPGIVREVSGALAEMSVNIVGLETEVEPAAWSGGALFRARAELMAPEDLPLDRLAETLERISAEIQVDIDLEGDQAERRA